MRLYRGLTIPYDPERVGAAASALQGTNFTDCPYTALRYAAGRRGEVLVLDVPPDSGVRVTKELWPGSEAERLMVWGRFEDHIAAILPAKELRAEVRRKGVAGQSSAYKRDVLELAIEQWIAEHSHECEQAIAGRLARGQGACGTRAAG